MLCKRIIPCLDVKNGRVVKGVKFENLRDSGDPVELAKFYYTESADEIVFLDISASIERRKTIVDMARNVAREIFIPFTIGGGIRSIGDIENILKVGADKISINTAAIENPKLIEKAAKEFGSQAIVIAIDSVTNSKNNLSGWNVYKKGGKIDSGLDTLEWAKKVVELGAGEILLTSIDYDGTRKGFNIELTRTVSNIVNVPVIASGGAGNADDFVEVFTKTRASGALAAGIFHREELRISDLKKYLNNEHLSQKLFNVRICE